MFYLKQSFVLICSIVFICVLLSANFYLQTKEKTGKKIFFLQDNRSQTKHDTITPLRGNKTFIITPYYDDREGKVIRTLAIVHHTDVRKLYCYMCCTAEICLQVSEARIDIHEDRFGFPFGLADIICDEPPDCQPSHMYFHESPDENIMSLTAFQIQNRERGEFTANFTVCLSTMFGNYSNALQFIQTMEMYKLLGAQKVTLYLKNCTPQIARILEYYRNEGTIEVIPWPIHRYLRPSPTWLYNDGDTEIGYYGQLSTLNDCLYRNMYRSKFVLLNDVDEIILPFKHRTWDSLMESLQRQNPDVGVFLFENHIFPQTISTVGNFSGVSSWKEVPGFNILQYIHREPDRPTVFNTRKMIVDPRKVVQTSVHSVLKSLGYSINVPLETALLHHCRVPLQPTLSKESLIEDKTLWMYNASLIRNVNQVLNQISLQ